MRWLRSWIAEFFLQEPHPSIIFCNLPSNPNFARGEMAERSIAAVLKTVEGQTSGGSNPSLSAFAHRSFSAGGPFYWWASEDEVRHGCFHLFFYVKRSFC